MASTHVSFWHVIDLVYITLLSLGLSVIFYVVIHATSFHDRVLAPMLALAHDVKGDPVRRFAAIAALFVGLNLTIYGLMIVVEQLPTLVDRNHMHHSMLGISSMLTWIIISG